MCVRLHQIDGGEMRIDLHLDQASELAAFLAAGKPPGSPTTKYLQRIETKQGQHYAYWSCRVSICFECVPNGLPAFVPEDSAKRLGAEISVVVSRCISTIAAVSVPTGGARRRTDDNLRRVFG